MLKRQRQPSLIPNYVVLIALVIFALGPLTVVGFNSLKDSNQIGSNPLGPPANPRWENFPRAWQVGNFSTTTRNSLILVAGTVVGVLSLGGLAAYSLAKLREHDWNVSETARAIDMPRSNLYKKIERFGLLREAE